MNRIRSAGPRDLPGVVDLISRLNAQPRNRSLHCAASTLGEVQRALGDKELFPSGWERSFVVADDPGGEISGVLGAQLDPDKTVAWLWGPWLAGEKAWGSLGPSLLAQLCRSLPPTVRRQEAFLHVENVAAVRFLNPTRILDRTRDAHLYGLQPRVGLSRKRRLATRRCVRRTEVAFANLHADVFPGPREHPAGRSLGWSRRRARHLCRDGRPALARLGVRVGQPRTPGGIRRLSGRETRRPGDAGSARGCCKRRCAGRSRPIVSRRRASASASGATARGVFTNRAGFTLQATGVALRRKL